jgi:RNA polymerase II-associated protein 2
MATKVPVKSILKNQSPQPASADTADAKRDRDRHNYNIALQHAYRIQSQKDWETKILEATEVLLGYPADSEATAQEGQNFTKLIQPFQPSDLDALVEERTTYSRCGYVLCLKRPRRMTVGKDAEWKVGKVGQDFCSSACARKSAHVKAQLSEIPVWERDSHVIITIELPEGDRLKNATLPLRSKEYAVSAALDELAVERGENAMSFKPRQVMTERVVEKSATVYKPLSSISDATLSHVAIEGYEPKMKKVHRNLGTDRDAGDEEEEDEQPEDDEDD